MNDIFDVLAEPIRRDILVHLRNAVPGDLAVGDIVGLLGSTQPTISKHLKVLREAGLVAVREDGQHRYYRVNPEPLAIVEGWVSVMSAESSTAPTPTSTASQGTTTSSREPAPAVRILPEVDFTDLGRSVGWIVADLAVRGAALLRGTRPTKSR